MSPEITINDKLIAAANKALDQYGAIEDSVSVLADGIKAILSPDPEDMLLAIYQIKYGGKTYYLGLPRE